MPSDTDINANRGSWIIATGVTVCVLAVLALTARLLARRLVKCPYNASDYTLFLGWAFSCVTAGAIFDEVHWGLGRHAAALPDPKKADMAISKIIYVGIIAYIIAFTFIKVSILLFYRSIFQRPHFVLATNIVGSCAIAWGVACTLVAIFICIPVRGFWDHNVPAKCISMRDFILGNSIPNTAIDVIILTLPIYEIYKLQKMALKTRVIVACMFALGGFVCVCSGIRLHFVLRLTQEDNTWTHTEEATWTIVELEIAVVCACLPTLRPLFRYVGGMVSHGASSSHQRTWKPDHNHIPLEEESQTLKGVGSGQPKHWADTAGNSDPTIVVQEPGKAKERDLPTLRDDLEQSAAYDIYGFGPGKMGAGRSRQVVKGFEG